MSNLGVTRADPPQSKSARWTKAAKMARETPGEWIKVRNCTPGIVHSLRSGSYRAFREGTWEFRSTTVKKDPRRIDIYVRLVDGTDDIGA